MTLNEFSQLSELRKVDLLYEHGVYIGKRKLGDTIVVLYQLEGFYAEVFYREYRRIIECISCFGGTLRLDPYLSQIHVEYLV